MQCASKWCALARASRVVGNSGRHIVRRQLASLLGRWSRSGGCSVTEFHLFQGLPWPCQGPSIVLVVHGCHSLMLCIPDVVSRFKAMYLHL